MRSRHERKNPGGRRGSVGLFQLLDLDVRADFRDCREIVVRVQPGRAVLYGDEDYQDVDGAWTAVVADLDEIVLGPDDLLPRVVREAIVGGRVSDYHRPRCR